MECISNSEFKKGRNIGRFYLWSNEAFLKVCSMGTCEINRLIKGTCKYKKISMVQVWKLQLSQWTLQLTKKEAAVCGDCHTVWPSSCSVLTWSTLRLCVVCILISSSKDTSQTGLGPTHVTLFNLNSLFWGPLSKYSHILRYWNLGLQHVNFRGHKPAHNIE